MKGGYDIRCTHLPIWTFLNSNTEGYNFNIRAESGKRGNHSELQTWQYFLQAALLTFFSICCTAVVFYYVLFHWMQYKASSKEHFLLKFNVLQNVSEDTRVSDDAVFLGALENLYVLKEFCS